MSTRPEIVSHEAEAITLGAILLVGAKGLEVVEAAGVRLQDFQSEAHRSIYRGILAVRARKAEPDFPAVKDYLQGAGELEAVGGPAYLAELADAAPPGLDYVRAKARQVVEAARRRDAVGLLQLAADRVVTADDFGAELARISEEVRDATRDATDQRIKLFSADALAELPPWRSLVDGMVPDGGLVVVYGPPESYKTFAFGIDAPACVATGVRFHGRAINRTGPAVLVSGEGRAGLAARLAAWKAHRQWAGSLPMFFRLEPVNLMDSAEVARFLVELETLDEPPRLIVFDTLARCMVGGDENSTADMGFVIRQADRIRLETGATVLLIHHSNKTGEYERGSSALRGAADAMVAMKNEDGIISVRCEKQKDGRPFDTFRLQPRNVGESVVLEGAKGPLHLTAPDLTQSQRQLLDELHQLAPSEGLSTSKLEELTELERRTFYHAKKALIAKGYVHQDRDGRGALHTITDRGLEALGAKVPKGETEGATTSEIGEVQTGGSIGETPVAPNDDCTKEERAAA